MHGQRPGANPARGATRPRARPAHHQRWAPEPPAAAARRPARPHRGPPAAALHPGTRVEPSSGARPQALQQCAVGRPRTAKPPCPSDAAPRQARDRRTAHRRRLQPRPRPRHPIAIYFALPGPGSRPMAKYLSRGQSFARAAKKKIGLRRANFTRRKDGWSARWAARAAWRAGEGPRRAHCAAAMWWPGAQGSLGSAGGRVGGGSRSRG